MTAGAITWVDPASGPVAFASAIVVVGIPLAAQPLLGERDLRVRDHAGALGRFHLDVLLGLVPVRNHSAERSVRREHELRLVEWVRALLRFERAALHVDWSTALCGYGFAVVLLWGYIRRGGGPTNILLLAYWLSCFRTSHRRWCSRLDSSPDSQHRSTAPRTRRRSGDRGDRNSGTAVAESGEGGVELRFEQVQVVTAGGASSMT